MNIPLKINIIAWLSRMRIYSRVNLLILIAIASVLILAVVYYSSDKKVSRLFERQYQYTELSNIIRRIETGTIRMQREQKNFLQQRDLKYAQKYFVAIEGINLALSLVPKFGVMRSIAGHIKKIKDELALHRKQFLKTSKLQMTIGLSENEGLEGEFRMAAHAVEKRLLTEKLGELTNKILMMRRHEKDFLLRRKNKYVSLFDARHKEFEGLLKETALPEGVKSEIVKQMDLYQSTFQTYSRKILTLKTEIKNLDQIFTDMMPHFEMIKRVAQAGKQRTEANLETTRAMTGNVFLAAIGFVLFAVMSLGLAIGKSITGPIINMTRIMKKLSKDDTFVEIPDTKASNEIGDMARAVKVFRKNILHRKQIEAELTSHKIAMDEHCIVATTDTSGTIINVNDKFCKISGYRHEELIGKNHRILNSEHHPKSFFTDMYRIIANGGIWHGEIRNRAKDGSFYWVSSSVTPIKDPEGKIVQYIAIRTDISTLRQREKALKDTQNKLKQVAYFDVLTGLANRAHCQKDMAEKFGSLDPDRKFAIIQIDLDNFKRVNDTLGHAAGDYLLKTLGDRMNLLTRAFDNFRSYRWGGDEFIALVERSDDTNLEAICEELTDTISIPLKYESATLRPTVSLGVARYPEDAQDIKSLMIFSDLALYRTKELGRDGFQFFTSEMKEKIDTESRVEQELRVAIENDQLELYFQPQLDCDDETVTGIEALIRWNHPQKGLLGPGDFLATSEATGLAPAIGCKVFEYAMAAIRGWVNEDLEFGRLAVNLSPDHLLKGSIIDDFFGTMEKYNIEPHMLAVEFLESFIIDDPNANIMETLHRFRSREIHVELDDFGTGYASLSHLSTMPINGLKIDKSFVDKMTEDTRQQGIVTSLISMAKLMKLRVVCEGIETRQQVDAITQIGKCSIQGYFITKPMSYQKTTDWLKSKRNIGALRARPEMVRTR